MEKRQIEIDLGTAKMWYKKGGEWKELALSVFEEHELVIRKELDFEEIRKKYEEKYPIGTVVYSNDGNNVWPYIIVSKPEIEKGNWYAPNGMIVFKTKVILLDKVYNRSIEIYGIDELENVEIRCYGKCIPFDYSKWKETKVEDWEKQIKQREERISEYEQLVDACRNGILNYEHDIEHFDEMYNACIEEAMKDVNKD